MVIWKYPLKFTTSDQCIAMPIVSKILSIQLRDGELFMWAEIEEYAYDRARIITAYMTGEEVSPPFGSYIATIQYKGLVWHFYDTSIDNFTN
jgi:hypothetical protein